MGVLSMAYFLAFVISAPAGALMAPRWGWQSVFGTLAILAAALLVLAGWKLAILLEGSYARHLAGATDDPFFARMQEGVPALARRALRLASGS